jgi:hypothetical protein
MDHPSDDSIASLFAPAIAGFRERKSAPMGDESLARLARALEMSADPSAWIPVGSAGDTGSPLTIALHAGDARAAALLLKHGATVGETELDAVCAQGDAATARLMAERGVLVWAPSPAGFCLLHRLALAGDLESARWLLKKGADPKAVERQPGRRDAPLHALGKHGAMSGELRARMAELLLDFGADAAQRDKEGATPLHWAMGNGRLALAEALLRRGAPWSAPDSQGLNPSIWLEETLAMARVDQQLAASESAEAWSADLLASEGVRSSAELADRLRALPSKLEAESLAAALRAGAAPAATPEPIEPAPAARRL